jgi:hypothetical protein
MNNINLPTLFINGYLYIPHVSSERNTENNIIPRCRWGDGMDGWMDGWRMDGWMDGKMRFKCLVNNMDLSDGAEQESVPL